MAKTTNDLLKELYAKNMNAKQPNSSTVVSQYQQALTPAPIAEQYGAKLNFGTSSTPTATPAATESDTYLQALRDNLNRNQSAYDIMYNANLKAIQGQQPVIGNIYDNARNQTYTAARVSALGNNERLAGLGLAGNANNAPKSGYSESSRITQDIALQNQLNALSKEQRDTVTALQNEMMKLSAQRQYDFAGMQNESQNKIAEYNLALEQNRMKSAASLLGDASFTLSDADASTFQKYYGVTPDIYRTALQSQTATTLRQQALSGEIDVTTLSGYQNKISEEDYTSIKGLIQKQNTPYYTSSFESLSGDKNTTSEQMAQFFTELDKAYESEEIVKEDYNKIYYDKVAKDITTIDSLSEYDSASNYIKGINNKLGSYAPEVQNLLAAKKAELNKKVVEKKEAEKEKLSNPGNPAPFIAEKIADSFENYIPKKDKEFAFLKPGKGAKNREAYVVKDKSNQKPVPQTSLSLWEKVSISITKPDGKQEVKEAKLTGYVTNDPFKKEDMWLELKNKNMKAGQIVKASDGKYYLRGNNAFFKLDVDMGW